MVRTHRVRLRYTDSGVPLCPFSFFPGNNIGDDGVVALADALSVNTTLQVLGFSRKWCRRLAKLPLRWSVIVWPCLVLCQKIEFTSRVLRPCHLPSDQIHRCRFSICVVGHRRAGEAGFVVVRVVVSVGGGVRECFCGSGVECWCCRCTFSAAADVVVLTVAAAPTCVLVECR